MYKLAEKIEKKSKKSERYSSGAVELPPYPGSVLRTYNLLNPGFLPAPHLKPLRDAFERAKREQVLICVSYPPRAGKTETVIAGIIDRLMWEARSRIAYISATGKLAQKKSHRIRTLAGVHGIPIDPATRSKQDWATGIGEGGLWATSVQGGIVGMGFELVCADDLIASREDAESILIRDRSWDFLNADVYTRLEPEGSLILNGTRWHEDDPIGRAVAEGWEEINIPALDEAGNSYWPKRWSSTKLIQIQKKQGGPDGYDWCSLYMGKPRAQGERVFEDPVYALMGIPPGPMRVGIGVDFAYTVKKSSDYSSAVVMAEVAGVYYVIDVYRARVKEAVFRAKVAELAEKYRAQFIVGYVAATERANITLLQRDNLPAFGDRAQQDKKTHALPTAANWNIGRIQVLRGGSWEKDFVHEVTWFTGSDRRDDQVDALCTVFDALFQSAPIDWDFQQQISEAAPAAFSGVLG